MTSSTPTAASSTTVRFRIRMPVTGWVGACLVGFWLFVAVFGPMLAPYRVGAFVAKDVFESFNVHNWFGSDYLGRDVLSRLLSGARYTVGMALIAAMLASACGTGLALIAAVSGRWVDEVVSRLMDALISIPSKIFALVLVATFGSDLFFLLLIAALTYIPGAFRLARSLAVNINEMDYVQVARVRGEGRFHIAVSEILPNMINPVLADFGLRFVFVVLLLSGLSFLGLGVQPPAADLGSLVRENISGIEDGAPAILMPALAIASLTIGMNLLIDAISGESRRRVGGA